METRHVIAYTLLALAALFMLVAAVIYKQRRDQRRRRLRGIKTDEIAALNRRRETGR